MTNNPNHNLAAFRNALGRLGIDPSFADAGFRSEHPFVVAVNLAMMGFRVFPSRVRTVKDKKSKTPHIREFQYRASAHPTDLVIWQDRFKSNWSVLTGRDNNLVILDIDGKQGREDLVRLESELGILPPTAKCNSCRVDGGFHIWLRPPAGDDDLKNQQPIPGTKIDVRGWHGYAVVAGSYHEAGRGRYSWAKGCAPDEVGVAECPTEWWAWLPKKETAPSIAVRRIQRPSRSSNKKRQHDWSSLLIGDGVGFGGFQNPIYKIGIKYFLEVGSDAPAEAIIEALRQMITDAPKDHGRDVSRYLSGPDLPRIVERARTFVKGVEGK